MDKSLTMEKIMETPWVTQTLKAVLILVVGWVLVLLLRLALEKFEKAISKTDAIRESGDVLRMKTFSHLLKWIGATLIWLCVIYMLLSSWELMLRLFWPAPAWSDWPLGLADSI